MEINDIYYCCTTIDNFSLHIASCSKGLITIGIEETDETFVENLQKKFPGCPILYNEDSNMLYIHQLKEYFHGSRRVFTVPLFLIGTEFQKKVWDALLRVPFGKVVSYKDIAIAVGNPKASRAVGMANNKNPIPIIIPCHRIIGSNKKLVGYGGGLHIKEKLLKLEGIKVIREKVVND